MKFEHVKKNFFWLTENWPHWQAWEIIGYDDWQSFIYL